MQPSTARLLNVVGLWGLSAILTVAFVYQFMLGELPCPLCLLQRAAFVAAGIGIALNVSAQLRPSHYGVTIISASAGAVISGRQVLLHIVPESGAYGSALFGLHFYTWAFVAFSLIVVTAGFMLLLDRQFALGEGPKASHWARSAVFVFGGLALLNAASTFAECGLGMCPDDPRDYEMLSRSLQAR
jgi:disulfide bond formation protein DsbB